MREPFKRKRIIEIYFVLYLVALILILPTGKEDDKPGEGEDGTALFDFPYALKPVSNVLNAKILITRDTVEILSIDSMNTIYYTGEVDNIDFEFVVEDLSINSELRISEKSGRSNKYFKIKEDKKRQAAVFSWSPPTGDSRDKTFMVTVNATVRPKNKTDEMPDEIEIGTDFSINVDFVTPGDLKRDFSVEFADDYFTEPVDRPGNRQAPPEVRMNTGTLTIGPGNPVINSLAGERWTNTLWVTGIDLKRELKTPPKITIEHSDQNNGGTANYTITPDNDIYIEGTAPDYGTNTVKIKITRVDGKTAETEFPIVLKMIGSPEMPKVLYPEITYIIDPKMPDLNSANSYSLLKSSDGKELHKAIGSKLIRFTPAHSDTGKSVFLERYINSRLSDKTGRSPIKANPAPKITYIQKISDTEVKIGTFSSGYYEGRQNITEKLIITGNADYYSLSGRIAIDKRNHTYEQSFMINPKNYSEPFEFSVRAVNVQGKSSEVKNWGGRD